MKRAGSLIGSVVAADNLREAFARAARGRLTQAAVRHFAADLDEECLRMRRELLSGAYPWGACHKFLIRDPKPRVISAAPFRDRVAHHALINVCGPYFESYLINDTYACRKGKGLDGALGRAVSFAHAGGWHLQLDIRKYFDSVDHESLLRLLARRFKDRVVLSHFRDILAGYRTAPGRGLPIGSLTSQYFANHYLGVLDHFIKERLQHRRYLRYMDDFVLWSDDPAALLGLRAEVATFLAGELHLELKPEVIGPCELGLTFCGYRVFPGGLRLSGRSRRRFRRLYREAINRARSGEWTETELARHVEPMLACVRRGASHAFRQRVIAALGADPEVRTG
jgi:hypothetical protein